MIIFLDTETTDITEDNRLVQLAYKVTGSNEVINEYFKPPVPISFGSMAVHHITNEMVADKPSFAESSIKNNLAKLLEENILVAHNALFDIQVLSNEGITTHKFIDTLRVARHLLKSEQYSLQYLRYSLGLNIVGSAHDALGDIIALEALYKYLTNNLKETFKLSSEEEIINKFLELTAMPVLLEVINFGKYRGKTFAEVVELDRGYLEWLQGSELMKKESEQNQELLYTLRHYL